MTSIVGGMAAIILQVLWVIWHRILRVLWVIVDNMAFYSANIAGNVPINCASIVSNMEYYSTRILSNVKSNSANITRNLVS